MSRNEEFGHGADKPKKHKIEEIIGVRNGVMIGCECGWTHHEKGLDARKGAKAKFAQHKAESA